MTASTFTAELKDETTQKQTRPSRVVRVKVPLQSTVQDLRTCERSFKVDKPSKWMDLVLETMRLVGIYQNLTVGTRLTVVERNCAPLPGTAERKIFEMIVGILPEDCEWFHLVRKGKNSKNNFYILKQNVKDQE